MNFLSGLLTKLISALFGRLIEWGLDYMERRKHIKAQKQKLKEGFSEKDTKKIEEAIDSSRAGKPSGIAGVSKRPKKG